MDEANVENPIDKSHHEVGFKESRQATNAGEVDQELNSSWSHGPSPLHEEGWSGKRNSNTGNIEVKRDICSGRQRTTFSSE